MINSYLGSIDYLYSKKSNTSLTVFIKKEKEKKGKYQGSNLYSTHSTKPSPHAILSWKLFHNWFRCGYTNNLVLLLITVLSVYFNFHWQNYWRRTEFLTSSKVILTFSGQLEKPPNQISFVSDRPLKSKYLTAPSRSCAWTPPTSEMSLCVWSPKWGFR